MAFNIAPENADDAHLEPDLDCFGILSPFRMSISFEKVHTPSEALHTGLVSKLLDIRRRQIHTGGP